MAKRVFLIVLDSVGIGSAPDCASFGDDGADTVRTISHSAFFDVPNLLSFGLGNIPGLSYLGETESPRAQYGKLTELSRGKDTTIGHWEIAGVISEKPLPVFPDGFPKEVISAFEKACGRKVLCNKPYSGTDVIRDYGEEHLKTGALIVYTSADSVFQIAAHEDIVPCEKLYEYCRAAREILTGEYAVGRVIARPFTGKPGEFVRTPHRHDFSLEPPAETVLDRLKNAGEDVIAVGKINDIFAGHGITEAIGTSGNTDGMAKTLELTEKDFHGLAFVNLVDFDMLYGHRNDVDGYARALSEFDRWLVPFTSRMKADDVLIITADHGCDPGFPGTDHTREYTPLIIFGKSVSPKPLGVLKGFDNIAKYVAEVLLND